MVVFFDDVEWGFSLGRLGRDGFIRNWPDGIYLLWDVLGYFHTKQS